MIEHHIQRDILNRLSTAPELRFSELKPVEIESNSFMYHLKQLIAQGYVHKSDNGYALDAKGLTYVDGLSTTNSRPRKQPKVVTVFVIKNKKGEYLLAQRKLQPFVSMYMFPSGKQHFGESPGAHVERELREQLSVSASAVRRGLIDQRSFMDGELITHVVGHVYQISYEGDPPAESKKFTYKWASFNNLSRDVIFPGTYDLFRELETNPELFFLSLDVQAD